jgi:hypothetical protein
MRMLLVLAAAGCTTTYAVQRPPPAAQISAFNESLRDRDVDLRVGGQDVHGRDLTLGTEATFIDAQGKRQQVPLEAVERVRFLSPGHPNGRGALEGGAIGLLGGAALGATLGFVSGNDTCSNSGLGSCILHFSASQKAAIGAIGLGAVGVLAGFIAGGLHGHHDELEFVQPP